MYMRIKMIAHGKGVIYIDDKPQKNVRSVEIEVAAGEPNKVSITYTPDLLEFEGEVFTTEVEEE